MTRKAHDNSVSNSSNPVKQRAFSQLLFLLLALLLTTCKAQQKSTTTAEINGQRFYIHKIERKQSLYAISKLYNVSIDTLYKLNPELVRGAKANQEIKVPVIVPAKTPAQQGPDTNVYYTHTIAKGETIYSLARRYGLSQEELLRFNPELSEGAKLGQVIIVGDKRSAPGDDQNEAVFPAPDVLLPPLPLDSSRFIPVSKPPKSVYSVSLLLPFKLDKIEELDLQSLLRGNSEFPVISGLSSDFYLGFKKAIDSLSAPGFSINLQLYDVDDNDTLEIERLRSEPQFTSSDLIIGPLYASSFRALSDRANELNIPIVSPFTQQNKILYNKIYISKTNPSQYTLLESLADYVIDSLKAADPNYILMTVSAKDRREGNYAEAFKNYFNNRMRALDTLMADTIRTALGIEGLKEVFIPGRKNVVIALNSKEVFIADFTTQLAIFAAGEDVVLCGWENVTGMDNIDQEYLNQLQYTFPHQYDVTKRTIPALDRYYKNRQHTSPSIYYYIGFDIACYYFSNLKHHGPNFVHRLNELPAETSFMRFKFARPDFTTGFDNRGVYIFRYKDYQLHKTGWK